MVFFTLFTLNTILYAQNYEPYREIQHSKDSTLQYKAFEDFAGDTLAYLVYNFVKRIPESYAGTTVEEFMKILPFPVISASVGHAYYRGGEDTGTHSVNLWIIHELGKKTVDGKCAKLYIEVGVTPIIKWEEMRAALGNHSTVDFVKKYTVTFAFLHKRFVLDAYRDLVEERERIKKE